MNGFLYLLKKKIYYYAQNKIFQKLFQEKKKKNLREYLFKIFTGKFIKLFDHITIINDINDNIFKIKKTNLIVINNT